MEQKRLRDGHLSRQLGYRVGQPSLFDGISDIKDVGESKDFSVLEIATIDSWGKKVKKIEKLIENLQVNHFSMKKKKIQKLTMKKKKKFKLSVQICKRFSSVILFKSFFRRLCKKTKKKLLSERKRKMAGGRWSEQC